MSRRQILSTMPDVRTREGLVPLKARGRRSFWTAEASWFVVCALAGIAALAVVWIVARLA